MYNERILCAGFGGQGVMSIGQLLAYAAMFENKQVTWMPSYGPEMRGGTAYCSVVLSDMEVGSPIVTGNATCAIIMNLPSLLKFEQSVVPGGFLLINSSLVNKTARRKDIHTYYIPAGELAAECGNPQAANIVMLGAYLALSGAVKFESITKAFTQVFGKKASRFMKLNRQALHKGADAIYTDEQTLAAA